MFKLSIPFKQHFWTTFIAYILGRPKTIKITFFDIALYGPVGGHGQHNSVRVPRSVVVLLLDSASRPTMRELAPKFSAAMKRAPGHLAFPHFHSVAQESAHSVPWPHELGHLWLQICSLGAVISPGESNQ